MKEIIIESRADRVKRYFAKTNDIPPEVLESLKTRLAAYTWKCIDCVSYNSCHNSKLGLDSEYLYCLPMIEAAILGNVEFTRDEPRFDGY